MTEREYLEGLRPEDEREWYERSDMTDELREALDYYETGSFGSKAYRRLRPMAKAARAHLSCSTITDEQVEAAAEALANLAVAVGWMIEPSRPKQRTNQIKRARAALEAAARVGTEKH